MYKWGYTLEKLQFTNLDLQICKVANVSIVRIQSINIAFTEYKTPFLKWIPLFGLQVWNDITHMYIYGTTNHKYWFTNLQLHGCNVRILIPLAFHTYQTKMLPLVIWCLYDLIYFTIILYWIWREFILLLYTITVNQRKGFGWPGEH